jgi:hypothetical protein
MLNLQLKVNVKPATESLPLQMALIFKYKAAWFVVTPGIEKFDCYKSDCLKFILICFKLLRCRMHFSRLSTLCNPRMAFWVWFHLMFDYRVTFFFQTLLMQVIYNFLFALTILYLKTKVLGVLTNVSSLYCHILAYVDMICIQL